MFNAILKNSFFQEKKILKYEYLLYIIFFSIFLFFIFLSYGFEGKSFKDLFTITVIAFILYLGILYKRKISFHLPRFLYLSVSVFFMLFMHMSGIDFLPVSEIPKYSSVLKAVYILYLIMILYISVRDQRYESLFYVNLFFAANFFLYYYFLGYTLKALPLLIYSLVSILFTVKKMRKINFLDSVILSSLLLLIYSLMASHFNEKDINSFIYILTAIVLYFISRNIDHELKKPVIKYMLRSNLLIFIPVLFIIALNYFYRLSGTYNLRLEEIARINYNSYGGYLVFLCPLVIVPLFQTEKFKIVKVSILTLIFLAILYVLQSRAAVLSLTVTMGSVLFFYIYSKKLITKKTMLIILSALALFFVLLLFFLVVKYNYLSDFSIQTRFFMWELFIESALKQKVLTGFGISSNFLDIYHTISSALDDPAHPYQVYLSVFDRMPHPHSIPVSIFFSFGLTGILIFFSAAAAVLRMELKKHNLKSVNFVAFAVLAAAFIHSFFDYILMDQYVYFPMAILLGVFNNRKSDEFYRVSGAFVSRLKTARIVVLFFIVLSSIFYSFEISSMQRILYKFNGIYTSDKFYNFKIEESNCPLFLEANKSLMDDTIHFPAYFVHNGIQARGELFYCLSLSDKNMMDNAISEYSAYMLLDEKNPYIYHRLSILYEKKGEHSLSRDYEKKADFYDPLNIVIHNKK